MEHSFQVTPLSPLVKGVLQISEVMFYFKDLIMRVGKGLTKIINTFTDTAVSDDKQVKRYY